jgi:hypothetical protein
MVVGVHYFEGGCEGGSSGLHPESRRPPFLLDGGKDVALRN